MSFGRGDRRSPSFLFPLVATGIRAGSSWNGAVMDCVWADGRTAVRPYGGTMLAEVSDFVPTHLGVLKGGVGE